MMAVNRRTRLLAHRGDPAHAPENTRASYESAVKNGARAVELDVRRSSDGIWVVFHDAALRRTAGFSGRVAETSWAVLKTLDAGGWFDSRFEGEPIPRLSEILSWCRRRRVAVFLDLKVNQNQRDLAGLLKRSGWLSRVMVGAGSVPSLKLWRRLLPKGQVFWVTGYRQKITPRRIKEAVRLGLTGIAAYRRWISPQAVSLTRSAGLKLYVWTARTPRQIRRLRRLGVDGIMSEVWPHPSI